MRDRGAAVILNKDKVALIKRTKNHAVYYVFPGGGIEEGESPEEATIREAMEELGVEIEVKSLLDKVLYNGTQYFFLADIIGGQFGTGTAEEFSSTKNGTYEPIWMDIDNLNEIDVRPGEIAERIKKDFSFPGEYRQNF